jgi:excisionase family DNA binding protein
MGEYLRPAEACKRLGIARTTLVRWINQGRIRVSRPSVRCTIIHSSELARFVNANIQPIPGANNRNPWPAE